MEMNFQGFKIKNKGDGIMFKKLGIGIIILQILFIVLKLAGAIHWSWIWVFAPIWLSVIIAVMSVIFDNLFN